MPDASTSILDRTLKRFRQAWSLGRAPLQDDVDPELPERDISRLRKQIDACLRARGGQVSARSRAAELGQTYLVLNKTGRQRFLRVLAEEYGVDAGKVDDCIELRARAVDTSAAHKAELALREALVPPRIKLLSQFNDLADGVKFLVDLRGELIEFAREDALLQELNADLHRQLTSWFDIGFLELRQITWETPASLLEKFIEYEAVHAVRSWDDLKNRLEADRRCYAFFHPNMPEEPLIFVQVALVKGMSDNIQSLLDESAPEQDPASADTAVFYSISNCHPGLAGVNFGDFLIKRVVDDLARQLPRIKSFATLSPIPAFREWLEESELVDEAHWFKDNEIRELVELTGEVSARAAMAHLLQVLDWHQSEKYCQLLRPILMRLCADYLVNARTGARASNRVAHFHLSNGARIERINWLADTSDNGLSQSAGLMVNYHYRLDAIERNHEAYTGQTEVTTGPAVRKLL